MTATVTPAEGDDVYNGDGGPDWQRARRAGQLFAYVKASEGITEIDARLKSNLAGMKAAGLLRGAYHFFRMADDPEQQANHFVNALRAAGYDFGADLPVCVDIEEDSVQGGSWTAAQVIASLARFNATVEAITGRRNLIYVDRSTAEEYLGGGAPFSGHDLWLAAYTSAPAPRVPYGWADWRLWQYSEFGTVDGVGRGSVDRDRFHGDEAALRAWAGRGSGPDAVASAIPQDCDAQSASAIPQSCDAQSASAIPQSCDAQA